MSDIRAILEFYRAIGIDETIGDIAQDRFALVAEKLAAKQTSQAPAGAAAMTAPGMTVPGAAATGAPSSGPLPDAQSLRRPEVAAPRPPAQAAVEARQLAESCENLEQLYDAVNSFTGCGLRQTAAHTVFGDGNAAADIMLIGDAPASDDDRLGRPFAGERGQFLDRMLASIGLFRQNPDEQDRPDNVYISNLIFWRPPGNRKPTEAEVNVCLPFTLRHIELAAPKIVIPLGAVATAALTRSNSNMLRLRGQWQKLTLLNQQSLPVLPIYGPDILLQKPLLKRDAWQDLLTLKARMSQENLALSPARFVPTGPVHTA